MLMAKKKLVLKRQVGDVSPDEYDWRSQFASLDPCDGYVPCDAGKVHGLAVALDESQARCTGLEKALNGVEPHVAGLQARLADEKAGNDTAIRELTTMYEARLAEAHASLAEGDKRYAAENARLQARLAEAVVLLRRYRAETPLGHQPYMIAGQVDRLLATADSAEGGAK